MNIFRFIIASVLCLVCSYGLLAQVITTYEEDGSTGTLLESFDQIPQYAGPDLLLFTYFENNVFASMPAKTEDVTQLSNDQPLENEYLIVMRFTLDSSGIPYDRQIISSNNLLMDDAFQKALQRMPGWVPAIIDGRYETVVVTIPLRYVIDGRFIRILGYGDWMYASSGKNFWLKLAIGAAAIGIFLALILN